MKVFWQVVRFKDIVDSKCGIRYYFEGLELSSGFSRKLLLETPMMTSAEEIKASYISVLEAVRVLDDYDVYESVTARLCELRDITATFARLEDGEVLDEIELFEIKHLALVSAKVRELLEPMNLCSDRVECRLPLPEDLSEVLALLDPDGLGINSFYIYDSYDPRLAELRLVIRRARGEERTEAEEKAAAMEAAVRASLSASLKSFSSLMKDSLYSLARLDIILAKAKMMEDKGYVIPKVLERGGKGGYEGLFHPQIADSLSENGRSFQPIDFSYSSPVTVLVGMNMGGKSVVLKMLALAQYLVQFGFAVPATSARVAPKDDVFLISGDAENSREGLSSFAGEIKAIDASITYARNIGEPLVLVDEPARTTNPIEGTALVSALVQTFSELGTAAVITTHYDIAGVRCRQLRVKGYSEGKMDYSLADVGEAGVPHEAIDTARRTGADSRWLDLARRFADNR